MLFNVHVVSPEEYNTYLKGLAEKGQTGELQARLEAAPGEGGER
jgi:cytochrome c oxidase subunit 2